MTLIQDINHSINKYKMMGNNHPTELTLGQYEILELNKIKQSNPTIRDGNISKNMFMGMELIESELDTVIIVN